MDVNTAGKRSGASKSMRWFYGILLVFLTVRIIFVVSDTEKAHSAWFLPVIFSYILCIFCAFYLSRSLSKSFMCVCEECVYGIAVTTWGKIQPFEVGFDRITNVEKRGILGIIRIKCGSNKYDCAINEPDEIIKLIREKINPTR